MPQIVSTHTNRNIAISAYRAKSTGTSLKFTVTPSRAPASAVAMPMRNPPKAVANSTAGKYGVKNTSGLISDRPKRIAVDSARQATAKPMLKAGAGCDVPCQPLRNSLVQCTVLSTLALRRRGWEDTCLVAEGEAPWGG